MGAVTPGKTLEINAGWHQSRAGPGGGRARCRPSCGWPLHPALLGVSEAASTQWCRAVGAGRDKGDDWLRIPSPASLEPSGPQESTQPFPRFQKTLRFPLGDLLLSLLRPLPTSPILRLPFAWFFGKPPTSGLAAAGGAKMAEQRLAVVSVEVLLGVPAARRGWAGPGGAERGTGGRPVSHGAASGEMRGRGWSASGWPGQHGSTPGNCSVWGLAEFFAALGLC